MINRRPSVGGAVRPCLIVTSNCQAAEVGVFAGSAARGARSSRKLSSGVILFMCLRMDLAVFSLPGLVQKPPRRDERSAAKPQPQERGHSCPPIPCAPDRDQKCPRSCAVLQPFQGWEILACLTPRVARGSQPWA